MFYGCVLSAQANPIKDRMVNMDENSGLEERRRSVRFRVRQCALVFDESQFGELVDISSGGLSFVSRSKGTRHGEPFELNIICSDGFHISQIPCRIVSDCKILNDQPVPILGDRRRIGVEFRSLSHEQQMELESFIKSHALGTA